MVLFVMGSAWILKSGWLHYGQNEHREFRDSGRKKRVGGCCSGGAAWGKREVQLTSVKGQAKTTVGDKPMLWWGKVEGLVYLHLASRLVLSKANFAGI